MRYGKPDNISRLDSFDSQVGFNLSPVSQCVLCVRYGYENPYLTTDDICDALYPHTLTKEF